ncbi:serine beta-lactamase-like protein LACTB, mitochondrial [Limulus polyphemus]|uniref:Serine beta-lactamase-like protein LACTB, mitochondrial n=1 Tax=Limulus polyphemus TaxID=6850 RepID=A0ABM1BE17_LIMPO|nr:serine beta-lactamase-like protein LACTB, mitochondrial [Limulus polyphemus]
MFCRARYVSSSLLFHPKSKIRFLRQITVTKFFYNNLQTIVKSKPYFQSHHRKYYAVFLCASTFGLYEVARYVTKNKISETESDTDITIVTQEGENYLNRTSSSSLSLAIKKGRDIVQRIKDEFGAPGIVVGVSVNGHTVWQEGFGHADVENHVPCHKDTVMRIASISKSITMIAIGKLWEEKKLDLDKPIQEYVPNFPEKYFENEKVTLTCRHLVSHLGGIRHYDKPFLKSNTDSTSKQKIQDNETVENRNSEKINEKKNNTKEENPKKEENEFELKDYFPDVQSSLELFKNDPLVNKPGSKFMYTTHGWTLLSAVVEAVVQEPFGVYMSKLFQELGLKNTFLDTNDTIIYNRSRYYRHTKDGLINAPYVDNSYKWAGGGLLSTVGDLLQFGNIMLYSFQHNSNNNNPLPGYLNSETVNQMWSPVTESQSNNCYYGLGWLVVPENQRYGCCFQQKLICFHTGSAVGARSVLLIVPRSCDMKDTRKCKWTNPPQGVIVSVIANLENVPLRKTALKVAGVFEDVTV